VDIRHSLRLSRDIMHSYAKARIAHGSLVLINALPFSDFG
jgi:hypothetical protein